MSEKLSNDNSDTAHLNPLSPGEILCRARKEKGLAAEEVMIHLGITQRTFNALENDEYDFLPSPLYVKGYIKRYCSILGISETQAITGFEARVNELGLAKKEPVVRLSDKARSKTNTWKIIIPIVVIVLLAFFIWFYLSGSNDESLPVDLSEQSTSLSDGNGEVIIEKSQESRTLEGDSESTAKNIKESDVERPTEQRAGVTQLEDRDVNIQQEVTQQKNIQEKVISLNVVDEPAIKFSVASDKNVLQISVTQQSWIEILDAKGDILLADLKTSGYQGEVKGMIPFDVILGYAPGVKLMLNGKRVEIPSIGNDNTAKLKIGDKEEG